jgi:hypothetical protein
LGDNNSATRFDDGGLVAANLGFWIQMGKKKGFGGRNKDESCLW